MAIMLEQIGLWWQAPSERQRLGFQEAKRATGEVGEDGMGSEG